MRVLIQSGGERDWGVPGYGRRYPIKRRVRVKNGVQGSSPCLTTKNKKYLVD